MEKYGFVYIWYDRKHKKFYIGCRWGNEKDGYICSSSWMKRAHKHRPHDFKRRTLSILHNKNDILEEEYKWLSLIKKEELGKKYYNLHNHHYGHWSTDENKKRTISEKISISRKRGMWYTNGVEMKFIQPSQDIPENFYPGQPKEVIKKRTNKNKGKKRSEEFKRKMSEETKGKKRSEEFKQKIREIQLGKKRPHSEETKQKISKTKKEQAHLKIKTKILDE